MPAPAQASNLGTSLGPGPRLGWEGASELCPAAQKSAAGTDQQHASNMFVANNRASFLVFLFVIRKKFEISLITNNFGE